MFRDSFRRELNEENVYEVLENCQSKNLGDRLENEWKKEMENQKPSLFNALLRMFGFEYLIIGINLLISRTLIT